MMDILRTGFLPPRDLGEELRGRVETLSREMAGARTSDLGRALNSDFSRLSQDARRLGLHAEKSASLSAAASWGQALQTSLNAVGADLRILLEAQVTAFPPDGAMNPELLADTGQAALEDMVASFNARQGGRALFGNGRPDGTPLVVATDILADVRQLAASASDARTFLGDLDSYFSPGGVLSVQIEALLPDGPVIAPTGEGDGVAWPVDMSSKGIGDALSGAAIAAVLPDLGFEMSDRDRQELVEALVQRAGSARDSLIALQGRVGVVEARIGRMSEDLDAAHASSRADLSAAVGIDPYETATRLQEDMSRLDTTYAIVAKRARLRLTDWLR